jgi:hypothetical protein
MSGPGWRGQPKPGSDAAAALGCRCPRLDNNHGRWAPWGDDGWWIVEGCPVHASKSIADEGVDVAAPSPKVG